LGLSEDEVDDLTDFIENALYDPAFVRFDPNSPTKMFQLSPPDFLYSVYRPDLKALGAIDGRPASGLPEDNNDALSRRDMGLEFLDVTSRLTASLIEVASPAPAEAGYESRIYRIANNGTTPVDTHLLAIADDLPDGIDMTNASGRTAGGDPYLRVFLPDGALAPGHSIDISLIFKRGSGPQPVSLTLRLLSGQGSP
jgi:hypothetical protein